jgi:WD40 repeat protein
MSTCTCVCAFLADGSTLASVAEMPNAHSGDVYSVAFSPDGTKIVSGSSDLSIKLWGVLLLRTQVAVAEVDSLVAGVTCLQSLVCVCMRGRCFKPRVCGGAAQCAQLLS